MALIGGFSEIQWMAVKGDVSIIKENLMDRRTFLISSGVTGLGALFVSPDSAHAAEPQSPETFSWNTGELQFTFSLPQGRLRQHIFLPSGIHVSAKLKCPVSAKLKCPNYPSVRWRRRRLGWFMAHKPERAIT